MAQPSNVGLRSVSDPVALRALAHPVRQQLQGLVGREGVLTAADAARMLGISHALASHHLRQLAKYGFVEQAEATDGRARPWRVTSTSYTVDPEGREGQEAEDALQLQSVERVAAELADWQRRHDGEDTSWARLGGVWAGLVYLTADELEELLARWSALVMPYVEARPIGAHDVRPADAVPVSVALVRAPLRRTEHGG